MLFPCRANPSRFTRWATIRVSKEIADFLQRKGYAAYQIIERRRDFLRGFYEDTVQFTR